LESHRLTPFFEPAPQRRRSDPVLSGASTGEPVPGRIRRASVNVAWTPSEFSYVRAEYSFAKADDGIGNEPLDRRFMIQLSYTIGFHPPHAY